MSISGGDTGHRALGAFVRSRRERLAPVEAGLPVPARRRTPGLRREEVAALSGVSLSWYTWLEQGRPINVSRQVLGALSRTLRLTPAEREHLYRLAGELPPTGELAPCPELHEHVRDLLTALEPNPALLLDQHWDIMGWNRAEAALITDFGAFPVCQRNLVWLVMAWAPFRDLLPNWEQQAISLLAQFRAAADEHPADPRFTEIINDLGATGADFARLWARHDIDTFRLATKYVDHPTLGRAVFRQVKLAVVDDPNVYLVIRYPHDQKTAERLPQLLRNHSPSSPVASS